MSTAYQDGNYLTEKGRALIAKFMASKEKIVFTKATVGSGTVPEGVSPKEMTALSHYEVDGVISDTSSPVPGEVNIVFQVFSRDVSVGFLATEAAIWAMDPDEGEILYTYVVIENSPEFIRAKKDPVQKFAEFTCINIVGSVEAEVTVVNPDAIVTRRMLEEWIDKWKQIQKMWKDMFASIYVGLGEWIHWKLDTLTYKDEYIISEDEDVEYLEDEELIKMPGGGIPIYTYDDLPKPSYSENEELIDIPETYVPFSLGQNTTINIGDLTLAAEPELDSDGFIVLNPVDTTGEYVLPAATADTLGGVKIGSGVHIQEDGTISVNSGSSSEDIQNTIDNMAATDDEIQNIIDNLDDGSNQSSGNGESDNEPSDVTEPSENEDGNTEPPESEGGNVESSEGGDGNTEPSENEGDNTEPIGEDDTQTSEDDSSGSQPVIDGDPEVDDDF